MKIDNSGNVIYRCTTDELAKQFLQECEEQGILWGDSGEKPTTNYNVWRIYKHRTCFSFENGRLFFGTLTGMHIRHSVLEYLGKDTKSTEELQAEIARLTAENARLKEQTKDFEVLYAGIKNGEVDMSVRGTTLKAITACFIQAFIQNGGTNFFLYDLQDDDGNKYSVTIQKATGKTPAEMLHESKAENAELHARLDKAVILPCKCEDTLYCVHWSKYNPKGGIITEEFVHKITLKNRNNTYAIYTICNGIWTESKFVAIDFGDIVFTDRAKAEARLAELKGGEGE